MESVMWGLGTENVWGEKLFDVKDFMRSNKIACGCYKQYHTVNEYISASNCGL